MNNLIDNAIKYATADTNITVSLAEVQGKIVLSVADEGVGVEEVDREKIFEKFYRSGAENTRFAKGTGLGLYLCKRIAEFHKANLIVLPNTPKGSNFIFTYYQN